MNLKDIDPYYVNCIGALYSNDHIINKKSSLLQLNLEEAIKQKTGVSKDFGPLVACHFTQSAKEDGMKDIKSPRDNNEVELDLFEDDLCCRICGEMRVATGNQLFECLDCNSLYHQECHYPPIYTVDGEGMFTCQICKDSANFSTKSSSSSSLLQDNYTEDTDNNSLFYLKSPSPNAVNYELNVIDSKYVVLSAAGSKYIEKNA